MIIARTGCLLGAGAVVVLLTGCGSPPREAATSSAVMPPVVAPRSSDASAVSAKQLWARTLAAGHSTPARVEVTETNFSPTGGAAHEITRFSAIEGLPPRPGQAPRYRLEYLAPANKAGTILLNDGSSLWRYDPRMKMAARRAPASLAPMPPELEEGVAALPAQADGARPEVESQAERVAGRPTLVLALRRPGSGRMLERRWIDAVSGRTLRWEQYMGRDARLTRRVEITRIDLSNGPTVIAERTRALTADFPKGTTLADHRSGRTQQLSDAQAAARRLRLPLHVRGFVLRSAQGDDSGGAPASHLLYGGSGGQYISVFVSPISVATATPGAAGPPAESIPLLPSANWRPVSLDHHHGGFSRETRSGSAVAWTNPFGAYYIAVSHLPLSHLLPVAAAFAANRDDAPGSTDISTIPPNRSHSWN